MKIHLIAVAFIIIFGSCGAPTSHIIKHQKFYTLKEIIDPAGKQKKYRLYSVESSKRIDVTIKEVAGVQIFTPIKNADVSGITETPILDTIGLPLNAPLKKYYFPETNFLNETSDHNSNIKYWEHAPSLQPLSFTFKIRPRLKVTEEDSFPSKIENAVNIGFTIGGKFQVYNYRNSVNVFKEKIEKRSSYSYGGFVNFSTVELNKSNTRSASLLIARNAPVISTGAFLSFGFSRYSFGYGAGFDIAIGPYSKRWVYQTFAHGKAAWLWQGFFVSYAI